MRMPRFERGKEVLASDLQLLADEVARVGRALDGAAGQRSEVGCCGFLEFFEHAGDVALDEVEQRGVNGDGEPNAATRGVGDSSAVEVVSAADEHGEFLYDSGATHAAEMGQFNWTVTRPARWFYGGVPADAGEESAGREGALVRGVRRRGEPGETVSVCMFPSAPEPMYFYRSMFTRSESWSAPQQVVVVPGLSAWQDVLLRINLEVHYVEGLRNYTRRPWTWGLEAQMDERGRVRFRSRCEMGDLQAGY